MVLNYSLGVYGFCIPRVYHTDLVLWLDTVSVGGGYNDANINYLVNVNGEDGFVMG